LQEASEKDRKLAEWICQVVIRNVVLKSLLYFLICDWLEKRRMVVSSVKELYKIELLTNIALGVVCLETPVCVQITVE
jgi:hypothetical protein